ncbi:MAG TPA: Tol-Pal system beta propeller repeat protein TolB [Casimicrobium sp.]|nr:Tol-Pal system beta propeller repeat protein TolB [Casimicrobium sp.]
MKSALNRSLAVLALPLLFLPLIAQAQLTIDIIGVGAQQIPVAVATFAGQDPNAQQMSAVIEADLARSGRIKTVNGASLPRSGEFAAIPFGDLKARSADAVVIGTVQPAANGQFNVSFRLADVPKQSQLTGLVFTVGPRELRATAHRIADIVYEQLTGEKGVFSTRLAYVSKSPGRFQLVVADSDGFNTVAIVNSAEPIISPSWSPDGNRLAYVSFEGRKPSVYVQNVITGERTLLVRASGNQSSPAWSPDGRRIVFASSQAGGTQLFMVNADGSGLRRLTNSGGIDTAPNWAPDGRIYFMSDRGGSPQIYRMAADGGNAERVTFEGSYNANPRVAADGKSMVFIKREGSREMLAVQDFASRQVQVLTQGPVDESPSFAPNGKLVAYASVYNGRGVLATVSADGRVKQRLGATNADVREPAWGPLPR